MQIRQESMLPTLDKTTALTPLIVATTQAAQIVAHKGEIAAATEQRQTVPPPKKKKKKKIKKKKTK